MTLAFGRFGPYGPKAKVGLAAIKAKVGLAAIKG